jgi:hypothetical protein
LHMPLVAGKKLARIRGAAAMVQLLMSCREMGMPSRPKRASCRYNGRWSQNLSTARGRPIKRPG